MITDLTHQFLQEVQFAFMLITLLFEKKVSLLAPKEFSLMDKSELLPLSSLIQIPAVPDFLEHDNTVRVHAGDISKIRNIKVAH